MKKYLNITLCALTCMGALSLTSCNGTDAPEDTTITELRLTVDKTTIEANNTDAATFTITDQAGRDVGKTAGLRVMNTVDGDYLDTDMKATAFMNGEMKFIARGNGLKSNEITITAVNRKKYEKYFRYIAMYVATGTWCQYCPNMTKALNEYTAIPGRMVRMAYHVNNSGGSPQDPFEIPASNKLTAKMNISNYPSAVVDLHTLISGYQTFSITAALKETLQKYPATCGVKIISSTYDANTRTVIVNPEVSFAEDGEYAIGWAILSDNLQASQKQPDTSVTQSYLHSHVVRQVDNVFGNSIGQQKAGTTWTPSVGFTNSEAITDPVEYMNVVVFVCKKADDSNFYINNLATCALDGGSIDYRLND